MPERALRLDLGAGVSAQPGRREAAVPWSLAACFTFPLRLQRRPFTNAVPVKCQSCKETEDTNYVVK